MTRLTDEELHLGYTIQMVRKALPEYDPNLVGIAVIRAKKDPVNGESGPEFLERVRSLVLAKQKPFSPGPPKE